VGVEQLLVIAVGALLVIMIVGGGSLDRSTTAA
jgi:hypothetical protein